MDIEYPGFGTIVVDGTRYDHDIVIEHGAVRARDKGPSRAARVGHTPLTAAERIPWSHPGLIVGTGYSGRLPVADDIAQRARQEGITLELVPTARACELLRSMEASDVNAILHVTC